ncbi:hypothetical protein YW3DRAFT_07161 [Streptomyces sp. MnatMP-M77]|nr:hypothetical protein YW3DRAFT_07161 [Streptomyces sp. MnatMP-M77]
MFRMLARTVASCVTPRLDVKTAGTLSPSTGVGRGAHSVSGGV